MTLIERASSDHQPRGRIYNLGLDLDEVIVDFIAGFHRLLQDELGPLPAGYRQTSWTKWGEYKQSDVDRCWALTHRPYWFERLGAIGATAQEQAELRRLLQWLDMHPDIQTTFLTNRKPADARHQSIRWLRRQGMQHPQVLVSKSHEDKGRLAALLELDLYVDDFWVNLQAVAQHSPKTKLYLYTMPHNEHVEGYDRISSTTELFRTIRDHAVPARAEARTT